MGRELSRRLRDTALLVEACPRAGLVCSQRRGAIPGSADDADAAPHALRKARRCQNVGKSDFISETPKMAGCSGPKTSAAHTENTPHTGFWRIATEPREVLPGVAIQPYRGTSLQLDRRIDHGSDVSIACGGSVLLRVSKSCCAGFNSGFSSATETARMRILSLSGSLSVRWFALTSME